MQRLPSNPKETNNKMTINKLSLVGLVSNHIHKCSTIFQFQFQKSYYFPLGNVTLSILSDNY